MSTRVIAGRYQLDQRLGRGGMAEVWRGIDRVLGRRVAVKTVSLADATDPTLAERLRREAVATAALEHPDIVTVHDAGVDGDTAYIVMERLRGQDLAATLRGGPLPLGEALRIGSRVAGALAAAHGAGIVHRDVKPANILVDGEKVTVVDFGIAAFEYQTAASLAAPGTTLGTAEYMAPEQARAESTATRSTDMYAFGCLLTAMVTGRPPFVASRAGSVLHHHVYIEPPRLSSLRDGVPAELDQLVAELLAKDPDRRPTATETAEVLAALAAAAAPGSEPDDGPSTLPVAVPNGFTDAPTMAPDAVAGPTMAPDAVAGPTTGSDGRPQEHLEP
ncbi:serine/threonine-protein kinase [Georgenia sp. M64]|uniref:serine/threonine-protein kinase n=1 Tax=Georgenia sp. M64 TaxID=3120520 RepID=UPI0030E2DB48